MKRARPISTASTNSAASNAQKVRRGDVRRAVVVRTKYPTRRPDGRYVRFDDNAAVLVNSKKEMIGNRIGGVVAAELRSRGWGKIVSLGELDRPRNAEWTPLTLPCRLQHQRSYRCPAIAALLSPCLRREIARLSPACLREAPVLALMRLYRLSALAELKELGLIRPKLTSLQLVAELDVCQVFEPPVALQHRRYPLHPFVALWSGP